MTCFSLTMCDDCCKTLGPHMHCHYCGFSLSLVGKQKDKIQLGEHELPVSEALWKCTNPECGKTEFVMSGVREAPLGCECREFFAG